MVRPVGLRRVGWALCCWTVVLAGCESSSSTAPPEDLSVDAVAGDGQMGAVGTELANSIVVRVGDLAGSPVPGVRVSFSVVAGGGSVSTATAETDSDGTASTRWTLGTVAGAPQLLRASLADEDEAGLVDFSATALAGAPERLEPVEGDDQLGQRTVALPEPLVVRVFDGFDNPVPGADVTFETDDGGGFEPPVAATDGDGLATSRWSLGPALGEQTATATVEGLASVTFSATSLEAAWIRGTVTSVSSGGDPVLAPVLELPPEDPSAPSVTVTGTEIVIPGGGGLYTLESDQPFSVVHVFVGGREGHYRLDLPTGPTNSADVVLTLADTLVDPAYQLQFAVGTGAGAGPAEPHVVEVHEVPTGPLQVSVSWDSASDVDLYLVEPSGETIYFESPSSSSGGTLDLDANGACIGDDLRNESITWTEETPPEGTYVVRLNLWSACQEERSRWVVTVRVEGQPPRTFLGEFTGEGAGGDVASGEVVTTFVF